MKKIKISHAEDDSSSFGLLPDEIVLQIVTKLSDLKMLCLCKPVSRRFYHIIHEVDTISFTSFNNPSIDANSERNTSASLVRFDPIWSAIESLTGFNRVKSLRIEYPCSYVDNHLLFKWKIKFGKKQNSFIFVSPKTVSHKKELHVNAKGHKQEDDMDLFGKKLYIALKCWAMFGTMWHGLLLPLIMHFPLLEKVNFADSSKRGEIYLSGGKVDELRKWLSSSSGSYEERLRCQGFPPRVNVCYIPLLELPVSGHVMKGVTFLILEANDIQGDEHGSFINNDDGNFEDTDEAVYSEAMMEILKKHRGKMESWILGNNVNGY